MTQPTDNKFDKSWQDVAREFTVAVVLVGALFFTKSIWEAFAFTVLFLVMGILAALAGAVVWVVYQIASDYMKIRRDLDL